jgi:hypothetical protein
MGELKWRVLNPFVATEGQTLKCINFGARALPGIMTGPRGTYRHTSTLSWVMGPISGYCDTSLSVPNVVLRWGA